MDNEANERMKVNEEENFDAVYRKIMTSNKG